MSNVDGDDNDVDGDLIFISEEHIDLEDSTHSKHDQSAETREELDEETEDAGADMSNTAADAEQEQLDVDDAEEEEQETEEQEGDEQEADEQEAEGQDEEKLGEKSMGKDGLMVVDEWDDNDLESELEEEATEKDEDALNPEDTERSLLHMPSLNSVLNDIGHLKQNRRLVIYPLTIEELESAKLKEIIANDACEEIKVDFVRSKSNPKEYTGMLVLNYMTAGSASQAVEEAKQIKEDITVKLETNTNSLMEQFVKEHKTEKRWTDNVLVVRNLIDDVKLESLKELFSEAEEVVIHKEASKRRESTIARGHAFLLYRTDTEAAAAAKEYEDKKLMLDEHRLEVLPYRQPAEMLPRGLLRLRERKVVMKHLEKLQKNMDKAKENSAIKIPKGAKARVDKCLSIIDRDNKARRKVNIEAPSLEELKKMGGLPVLTATDCHRFLIRLGIIDEKKEPAKEADDGRPSNKRERSKSSGRRNSDRNNQRSRQRASSPRNLRRSPPRKRNWIQNNQRNQQQRSNAANANMMRNSMGAGMINPLALMMQQQMLGQGAMLNPGMMIPQNMGPAMLGPGGLIGNVPQPNMQFLGPMIPPPNVHGMEEPGSRLLRLDEAGNFRSTDDRRFHERDHRRNEGQRGRGERDNRSFRSGDLRQERHHRSRSPDDRSTRNVQRVDIRSYGESSSPGGDPRDVGTGRLGEEGEATSPANLLYNLSKMLSQKLEQKRQQVERERRGYDRGEYHSGPR